MSYASEYLHVMLHTFRRVRKIAKSD